MASRTLGVKVNHPNSSIYTCHCFYSPSKFDKDQTFSQKLFGSSVKMPRIINHHQISFANDPCPSLHSFAPSLLHLDLLNPKSFEHLDLGRWLFWAIFDIPMFYYF
jgi:hypothetical protein